MRAEGPGLPREKGATYLEDFFDQPYRLKVLTSAPIYYNADLARYLGTLRAGQLVELQAIADGRVRVRGQAQQGQVAGWVDAANVSALDPALLDGLKRTARRRERVAGLIARGEVALGMAPTEVAAALGQPMGKSSRVDANGTTETWDYVRYQRVARRGFTGYYDNYGRPIAAVGYEKVAVGTFSVVFTRGVVSAVEQSEGSTAGVTAQTRAAAAGGGTEGF